VVGWTAGTTSVGVGGATGGGGLTGEAENNALTCLGQRSLLLYERCSAGNSLEWSSGSGDDWMMVLDGGAPCSNVGGGASSSVGSSGSRALFYDGDTTRGSSYCGRLGARGFGAAR
jgi:hypothetical protein